MEGIKCYDYRNEHSPFSKVKTGLVPERRNFYWEFKPENKRIQPSVREIV